MLVLILIMLLVMKLLLLLSYRWFATAIVGHFAVGVNRADVVVGNAAIVSDIVFAFALLSLVCYSYRWSFWCVLV